MECNKCICYDYCFNIINKIPPIEVSAHYCDFRKKSSFGDFFYGEWIIGNYTEGLFAGFRFEMCSICQFERIFDASAPENVYEYCPNCGSRLFRKVNL